MRKATSIEEAFKKDIMPAFMCSQLKHKQELKNDLRSIEMTDQINIFIDNDDAYLQWMSDNPSGYVVNCYRKPTPDYLILHYANCGTIKEATRGPGIWTSGSLIKVCSLDKTELDAWAKDKIGGELQSCQRCKP